MLLSLSILRIRTRLITLAVLLPRPCAGLRTPMEEDCLPMSRCIAGASAATESETAQAAAQPGWGQLPSDELLCSILFPFCLALLCHAPVPPVASVHEEFRPYRGGKAAIPCRS